MIKKIIKKILKYLGYKISRVDFNEYPYDIDKQHIREYKNIKEYTVTNIERIDALLNSVKYISENDIEGDLVECGVWRGGSCMAMAKQMIKNNDVSRKIWLYDTFQGMTEPTEKDIEVETGKRVSDLMENEKKNTEKYNVWAYAPIDEVKNNMINTNYPIDNINFIVGKVEDTLYSDKIPNKIALLRLDTDWYESTKIELEVLYPLLSSGGILIVDDYGHFEGARKAVDEYFSKFDKKPYIHRIDYTARIIIKQ